MNTYTTNYHISHTGGVKQARSRSRSSNCSIHTKNSNEKDPGTHTETLHTSFMANNTCFYSIPLYYSASPCISSPCATILHPSSKSISSFFSSHTCFGYSSYFCMISLPINELFPVQVPAFSLEPILVTFQFTIKVTCPVYIAIPLYFQFQ